MKKIKLTNSKYVLVDDEDFKRFSGLSWNHNPAGTGYASRQIRQDGKVVAVMLHREIVNAPFGMDVDHINGNTLDNRRINLRIATHQQNMMNCKIDRKNNTSGFKGVSWASNANQWRAKIQLNGKAIVLGYFKSKILAADAYNQAALKYFGEFAKLNCLSDQNRVNNTKAQYPQFYDSCT